MYLDCVLCAVCIIFFWAVAMRRYVWRAPGHNFFSLGCLAGDDSICVGRVILAVQKALVAVAI